MNGSAWQRFVSLFVVICLLINILIFPTALAAAHQSPPETSTPPTPEDPFAKIESLLFEELTDTGETDFFVWLKEKADLSGAALLKTKAEKGAYVYNALVATAESSQKNLRAYLDSQHISYEPFFISNKIFIRQGSEKLLLDLASRTDIAHLSANHEVKLQEPYEKNAEPAIQDAPGSNISFIQADQVWAMGITGQGMVLAGNDTGLDVTHPAIAPHYRGCLNPPSCTMMDHNYNWFDAFGNSPNLPFDNHGHGTHTTGTMVGSDGISFDIGVAPGAKTIHCRNMDDGGYGYESTFTTCFQWDLAPTDLTGSNPRPDLAPAAVNNSWGYSGGSITWFEDEIAALQAAGILVEVSAGNSGPYCSSLGSPGDYASVLTTGSVSHYNGPLPGTISSFSSRGPSNLYPNEFVPDIMAPGSYIHSSVPWGGYESWSGTSMAGPHTTGLVALLWEANPALQGMVEETIELIKTTAVPLTGEYGYDCGGDYLTGPNHDWGHGTINALAAVEFAIQLGGAGEIEGTVTDASTQAVLSDSLIHAAHQSGYTRKVSTDSAGYYSLQLFSGTYTVEASKFGYLSQSHSVEVITGTLTIQDFQLQPAPFHTISGIITDQLTGWPLYASLSFPGIPFEPIWTDPVTGYYSVSLPAGSAYEVVISAWVGGYQPSTGSIGPVDGNLTHNFGLLADQQSCTAPGYTPKTAYQEDFENDNGNFLPVYDFGSDWEWGIPTSWPDSCASGDKCWGTNLSGYYRDYSYDTLYSPVIDLSAYSQPDLPLQVKWQQAFSIEECCDSVHAEISVNNGYWEPMGWFYSYDASDWEEETFTFFQNELNQAQFRFRLTSDGSVVGPGYFIDNLRIIAGCEPEAGGLVVGNVYENINNQPVPGALVSHSTGASVLAQETPFDPAVDDAFYTLFAPAGSQVITATKQLYSPAAATVAVLPNATVAQDFFLGVGHLTVSPSSLATTLDLGQTETLTLTLLNDGTGSLDFKIKEQDLGVVIPTLMSESGSDLKILLLQSDYTPPPLQQALESYPEIGQVDLWYANQSNPGLADLLAYDVVILWRFSAFADRIELGNLLANYVDQGGKVIQAVYNWGYPLVDLGGRFVDEGYSPLLTLNDGNHNSIATLGDFDPVHPILDGVTGVSDWRRDKVSLAPDAELVASWSDGEEFIAVKEDVVAINSYPSPASGWDGDLPLIFRNAVLYLKGLWDVVWLSEDPETGVLSQDESLEVAVTFDAGAVHQPGEYHANLWVKSPTPVDPSIMVPVTMTINIPDDWGMIEGHVTGLGYCDENPAFLPAAQVVIENNNGQSWITRTDAAGFYRWWADSAGSPYTITVNNPNHQSVSIANIIVVPAESAILDVSLRSLQPCFSSAPGSFAVTLEIGQNQTLPLTLTNQGASEAVFTLYERDHGHTIASIDNVSAEDGPLSEFVSFLPRLKHISQNDEISVLLLHSNNNYYLLQQSLQNSPDIGLVDQFYTYYETPQLDYLLQYDVVINWTINGYNYHDALGNVLADYLDAGGSLIQAANSWGFAYQHPGGRFSSQSYSPLLSLEMGSSYYNVYLGQTDFSHPIMQGVINAQTNVHDVVGLDPSAELIASWSDGEEFVAIKDNVIAVNADPSPYPSPYPGPGGLDEGIAAIFNNAVRFLVSIRDIIWLAEDPESGLVPPDSSTEVDLLFDSAAVDQPGDYYGSLLVKSSDQFQSSTSIPLTLTVTAPASWGMIEGSVTGLGYCDTDPGLLPGAQLLIQNSTGQTWTTQTSANGFYRWWADSQGSPYTITVSEPAHLPVQVNAVELTAQQTTLLDIDLRLLTSCLTLTPPSLEANLLPGLTQSLTLTLNNQGAGEADFVISEKSTNPGLVSVIDKPNILLLHLDDHEHLYSYLQNHPDIGEVDWFWAGDAIPTLADLLQYDLVIFWQDYYSSQNLVAFGNLLADYADSGGKIILAGDNWNNIEMELSGRFQTGAYNPFISLNWGNNYQYAILGEFDPSHPIMENVNFLADYSRAYVTLQNQATLIASWIDEEEFIATKGNVVAINTYANSYYGLYYEDLGLIFTNAIKYLAHTDIPWLSTDPSSGSLAGDSSGQVTVTLDASQISDPGLYEAALVVKTRDGSPAQKIPVKMVVGLLTSGVELAPQAASALADPGETVSYQLTLKNTGNFVDTFSLAAAGNWPAGLPDSIGPLAPGASASFDVTVEIPSTAAHGSSDILSLTAASLTDPLTTVTALLTTRINDSFGCLVTAGVLSQTGIPGQEVTYSFKLTNTGSAKDRFHIALSGNQWAVALSENDFALPSGKSRDLFLTVTIPGDVYRGATDSITLKITSQGPHVNPTPVTFTTTAIFDYQVYLPFAMR